MIKILAFSGSALVGAILAFGVVSNSQKISELHVEHTAFLTIEFLVYILFLCAGVMGVFADGQTRILRRIADNITEWPRTIFGSVACGLIGVCIGITIFTLVKYHPSNVMFGVIIISYIFFVSSLPLIWGQVIKIFTHKNVDLTIKEFILAKLLIIANLLLIVLGAYGISFFLVTNSILT